ncbi:phage N-6-adenine-methyltransferase [Escherichia coli]|uniref:phage N-6-adenine-methyltransferase n=2 Tax=Escherichia coli TaxID=562 RepID=UPI000F0AC606|nr:phage N-6-adenine-methyltransferase [Escherichia coli]
MSNKYCQALAELRNKPAHELKEVGDQWRTPDNIFWGINTLFGPFVLDLFTDGDNAKCAAYYTAEDNALAHDWSERLPQRRHPRRTRKRRKPAQNPQKRLPHRPPVRRRHRHHRRLLQKMRRPDKRPQRRAAPRQHPRRRQRQLAVRRRQHRAKVRRNPRQRAPRQRQNGQRILHPPWRLRMQVRRKRG